MKYVKAIILLSVILPLIGCATVLTGGGRQTVRIDSNPRGANVTIDNGMQGITPFTVKLTTNRDYRLTAKKEGYRPSILDIWQKPNLGLGIISIAPILAGASKANMFKANEANGSDTPIIIGFGLLAIDIITDSCYRLNKDTILFDLIPESASKK